MRSMRIRASLVLVGAGVVGAWTGSCGGGGFKGTIGGDGLDPNVVNTQFAPPTTLVAADVDRILSVATRSTNNQRMSIVIVDRLGIPLRIFQRGISGTLGPNPTILGLTGGELERVNFAHGIARAAAFLSHSEAPLSSRTGEFLTAFHTPAKYGPAFYDDPLDFIPVYPGVMVPQREILGITNTGLADLYQIDASNRGTFFAQDPGLPPGPRAFPFDNFPDNTSLTVPPTVYEPGFAVPVQANPDGTTPSPGLGPLPGGMPLYKRTAAGAAAASRPGAIRRHVGAIGVYIENADGTPNFALADSVATQATAAIEDGSGEPYSFLPIVDPAGGVFLVGLLLPFAQIDPPAGLIPLGANALASSNLSAADDADQIFTLDDVDDGDALFDTVGTPDPEEQQTLGAQNQQGVYVIAPTDSSFPFGLTATEVDTIIQGCRQASRQTHAAIRLPPDAACRMWISICDLDGRLLGVFRQVDATLFSYEISLTKARNATYFSNPDSRYVNDPLIAGPLAGRHPLTGFVPDVKPDGTFKRIIDGNGNLIGANGQIENIFPVGDPLNAPNEPGLTTTGIAVTARSLGFLGAPFFPPTIDPNLDPGPLFYLVLKNRHPDSFVLESFRPTFAQDPVQTPQQQVLSGIIFFPGAAPLYKNGQLVGGIGVSGDGVSQDDIVTFLGIRFAEDGFTLTPGIDGELNGTVFPPLVNPGQPGDVGDLEPADAIKSSSFSYQNIAIPYMKFPQNPGG